MTVAAQSLLAELDLALVRAPVSWRRMVLRQILDLFVGSAELYSDDQIDLFDAVMCRLIKNIDRAPLVELSNRLAGLDNAPINVLGSLARHADVAISGPVIAKAKVLPDKDLIAAVERDRLDMNLLTKIAARPQLSEAVTDVLLLRGNRTVQRMIIDNPDARVSEAGFARLVLNLNGDKKFAAAIAARKDVPAELRLWLAPMLNK